MSILDSVFDFRNKVYLTEDADANNLAWLVKRYREFRGGNTGKSHDQAVNDVLTSYGPHLAHPALVARFTAETDKLKNENFFPQF